MSESASRRERRMSQQKKGLGGGGFEKVFDSPENVPKLPLQVMTPIFFDIIPVLIDNKHPNYSIIKKDADDYKERCDDWCVPYSIHKGLKGVSQHVCRSWGKIGDRKCPTCDLRKMAIDGGADPKSAAIKEYNVSQRVAMCACVVGGENDGEMFLLEGAKSWIYDPIKNAADALNVWLADTSIEGMTVKATPQAFTYTDNKTGKPVTIPGQLYVEFVPRTYGYTDEDLEDAFPICDYLNFKSYEDIFTMVNGLVDASAPAVNPDDEEITTTTKEVVTPTVEATPVARTPNTSSRRGGRGPQATATAPAVETAPTTRRGRRGAPAVAVETEDDIAF